MKKTKKYRNFQPKQQKIPGHESITKIKFLHQIAKNLKKEKEKLIFTNAGKIYILLLPSIEGFLKTMEQNNFVMKKRKTIESN